MLISIRQIIATTVSAVSVVLLVLVWVGWVEIFPLKEDSFPHVNTVLATLIPTTATFGIAAIAIIFLTAQVSAAYGKPSVLRELYRSRDIYILFYFLLTNIVCGYVLFILNTDLSVTFLENKLLDTVLISAVAALALILPTLMAQIENLDPVILASKLSSRINALDIKKYGLTDVKLSKNSDVVSDYNLVTVGLRPHGVDPLRPMHEIILDSVKARDRVLFGKLFRYLLQPIARFHGAFWDPRGIKVVGENIIWLPAKKSSINLEESLHLTLAIMHYAVKRARNLRQEWGGLDIGRHGILTGICDLIRSLARHGKTDTAIQICLFAAYHIERDYLKIKPYGRVEPMNAYFEAAKELMHFGKNHQADFCISLLAWATANTEQISPNRSGGIEFGLSEDLLTKYESLKNYFLTNPEAFPTDTRDPWKDW